MCKQIVKLNNLQVNTITKKVKEGLNNLTDNTDPNATIGAIISAVDVFTPRDATNNPARTVLMGTNFGAYLIQQLFAKDPIFNHPNFNPELAAKIKNVAMSILKIDDGDIRSKNFNSNMISVEDSLRVWRAISNPSIFRTNSASISGLLLAVDNFMTIDLSKQSVIYKNEADESEFMKMAYNPQNIAFSILDVLEGRLPVMFFNPDDNNQLARDILDALKDSDNAKITIKKEITNTNEVGYFLYINEQKAGKMFDSIPHKMDIYKSTKDYVNLIANEEGAFDKGYDIISNFLATVGALEPNQELEVKLAKDKTGIGRIKTVTTITQDKQEYTKEELLEKHKGNLTISDNTFQDLRPIIKLDGTPISAFDVDIIEQVYGRGISSTTLDASIESILSDSEKRNAIIEVDGKKYPFSSFYMVNPNFGRMFSVYSFTKNVTDITSNNVFDKGVGRLMINNATISFQELLDIYQNILDEGGDSNTTKERVKSFFDTFYMNQNYTYDIFNKLKSLFSGYVDANYDQLIRRNVSESDYSTVLTNLKKALEKTNGVATKDAILKAMFSYSREDIRKLNEILERYNKDVDDASKLNLWDINFFYKKKFLQQDVKEVDKKEKKTREFIRYNLPAVFTFINNKDNKAAKYKLKDGVEGSLEDLLTTGGNKGFSRYSLTIVPHKSRRADGRVANGTIGTIDTNQFNKAVRADQRFELKYGAELYLPNIYIDVTQKQESKTIQQMIDESFTSEEARAEFIQKITDIIIDSKNKIAVWKIKNPTIQESDILSTILNINNVDTLQQSTNIKEVIASKIMDKLKVVLTDKEQKICLL